MFLFVDTDRMIAAILTILYNAISPTDKGISFINIVTIVIATSQINPLGSSFLLGLHCCPEKFYHSVSCLGPLPSGTLAVRSV